MHDCGFIVVENPNAGKKTAFQVIYPIWFKIKRFPSRLIMKYQRYRKLSKGIVIKSEYANQ